MKLKSTSLQLICYSINENEDNNESSAPIKGKRGLENYSRRKEKGKNIYRMYKLFENRCNLRIDD